MTSNKIVLVKAAEKGHTPLVDWICRKERPNDSDLKTILERY